MEVYVVLKILLKNEFVTDRLYLRKMKETDSKRLFEIWSDPVVTKYMNIEELSQEEQAKEIIQLINELANENKAIRYTIIEKQTKEIIGTCGFNEFDEEYGIVEIGYELDQLFWGKGYAPEAITCLVQYAFAELKLTEIIAKVNHKNNNSIRALHKLGFTFKEIVREYEESIDGYMNFNVYCKRNTL